MSHHTSGIHAVLSQPWAYRTYQRAIGSHKLWRSVIDRMALTPESRLLDIGCGPGDLVAYLPPVEYVGFDLSEAYIEEARERYGEPWTFFAADVADVDPEQLGRFDVVLAHSLLHHVPDDVAAAVCALASRVLKPGGRFITVDGCYEDGQSRVAKFLLDQDRGKAVRTADGYRQLAAPSFGRVDVHVDHRSLRIPYTMVILEATEPTVAR